MRRTIGWISILLVVLVVAALMTFWSLRDESILDFTSSVGSLAIGIFASMLFGLFIAPLLDKEE